MNDKPENPKVEAPISAALARTAVWDTLLGRYGHGAVQLAGEDNAFYERHLVFDNVVDPAFAQSARTLRGLCPLDPRYPRPALGHDAARLQHREPEAHLLSLDGIPDRPFAAQQCQQSGA